MSSGAAEQETDAHDQARPPYSGVRAARVFGKGLLGVAALVSAAIVVAGAGFDLADRYNERFRWREAEYDKLRSLHAGYSLTRFKAVLGTPVFSRRHPRTSLREDSFRRRDHWVQAVSRRDGTVLLYSVTSCDRKFRPEFSFSGIDAGNARVVLQQSTMAGVLSPSDDSSVMANYTPGVTANSTYMDEWYGANPGNYKEYAWGLNDACSDDGLAGVHDDVGFPMLKRYPYRGEAAKGGAWVTRFRRRAVVNTYAETPPLVPLREIHRSFQTGVDRILTRTAD